MDVVFVTPEGATIILDVESADGRETARSIIRSGGRIAEPTDPGITIDAATREDLDRELRQELENQTLEAPQAEEGDWSQVDTVMSDMLEDMGALEEENGADSAGDLFDWTNNIGDGLQLEEYVPALEEEADLRERFGLDENESGRFFIEYKNVKGQEKQWEFTLLPAIDNNLSIGVSSPVSRGNGAKVPEARPGLMVQTVMRHKNIPIPGSVPVVQTIGPEMMVIQLVGAFVGNELDGERGVDRNYTPNISSEARFGSGEDALYAKWGENLNNGLDSYEKARVFNREVVLQGAPIILSVISRRTNNLGDSNFMLFVYEAVITGFKIYAARQDRTYYALNALITDYEVTKQYASALEIDRSASQKLAEERVREAQEEADARNAEDAENQTSDEEDTEEEGETTDSTADSEALEDNAQEGGKQTGDQMEDSDVEQLEDPSLSDEQAAEDHEESFGVFEDVGGGLQ